MGSSSSTQAKQQQQPTNTPTSTEKKPHIVTKTNQPQSKQSQQQPQLITDKEINNIVDSVGNEPKPTMETFLLEQWYDAVEKELQNNETVKLIKQQNEQFNKQYIIPLKQTYNKIPLNVTAFKFAYLNKYDYNDRLLALGLLSMIVGVRSFKRLPVYQLPLRTFSALKDSAVVYFLAGLLLAPEIYNPLMHE